MKVLLFAGAGASVELGVPTMRPMMEQLLRHLENRDIEGKVRDKVRERMADDSYDIEDLIGDVDAIITGEQAERNLGFEGEAREAAERVKVLRQEIEWFIHHACERVTQQDASLLWGWALNELERCETVIATTNYDRSIELAANDTGIEIVDGFAGFEEQEFCAWTGLDDRAGEPLLLKLHGSTDWYRTKDGEETYKLRHPMPLYGGLIVQVAGAIEVTDAAVLPSREKVVREQPYDDIRYQFDHASRQADVAFFVGSSFRDPDLKSAARRCAERVPTYVVGPETSTDWTSEYDRVEFLEATASQFLCSALPCALAQDNVGKVGDYVEQYPESTGILEELSVAFNDDADEAARCAAIEELSRGRVSLVGDAVEKLLSSESKAVSRDAVGLVADSPHADKLLEVGRRIATERNRPELNEEIDWFEELYAA